MHGRIIRGQYGGQIGPLGGGHVAPEGDVPWPLHAVPRHRPWLGVDNNPGAQVHADQSVSSQCHMEVVHDARTWTISSMPRSPGSRGVIARLKSSDSRMTHSAGNSMFDAVEKIT